MKKLKDPCRFADFVEGSGHINESEYMSFENSIYDKESEESDSESDENGVLNEIENYESSRTSRNNSQSSVRRFGDNYNEDLQNVTANRYNRLNGSRNTLHGLRSPIPNTSNYTPTINSRRTDENEVLNQIDYEDSGTSRNNSQSGVRRFGNNYNEDLQNLTANRYNRLNGSRNTLHGLRSPTPNTPNNIPTINSRRTPTRSEVILKAATERRSASRQRSAFRHTEYRENDDY